MDYYIGIHDVSPIVTEKPRRRKGPGEENALKGRFFPEVGESGKRAGGGPVWLTDDPTEARRLQGEGECVAFVLTRENRELDLSGIPFCFAPEEGDLRATAGEEGCREDGGESLEGRSTESGAAWVRRMAERIGEEELGRVWQRHAGLPWRIADTRRLSIRETTEDDADILYRIQKDAQDAGFLEPMEEEPAARREVIRAYRRYVYGFYGFGIWTVTLRPGGQVIGRAGLEMAGDAPEPCLGFAIAPEERGKGYAKEACRAVLRYGFEELDLPAVRARVRRDNAASRKLCEELGFFADQKAQEAGGLWTELLLDAETFERFERGLSGSFSGSFFGRGGPGEERDQ